MARLIFTYDTDLLDDIFKEKLGERSIKEITRSAHERSSGSLGFAEAILCFYNKKMKNPLDVLKLYTTKGRKSALMYAEDDEPENINDYVNGTDNPSLTEEADDQQSFLLPMIPQEKDFVLFQNDD